MNAATALLADSGFGGDHMNGWGGGWMWLWGVAVMALVVILIVWLARAGTGSSGAPAVSGSAPRIPSDRGREILAERYAHGELTTEEYRQRLNELQ